MRRHPTRATLPAEANQSVDVVRVTLSSLTRAWRVTRAFYTGCPRRNV